MFAACLWPFDFTPSNEVHWLREKRGVRFTGMGQIVSREEFPSLSKLSPTGSLTVEIAVRPAVLVKSGVPRILTFHPVEGPSPLTIGTWVDSIVVRVGRAAASDRRRYREIGNRDAFKPGETAVVTVATGPAGTALYLDGRLRNSSLEAALGRNHDSLGILLLGISPTGNGEWKGDILGLRIYNRILSETEVLLSRGSAGTGAAPPRELKAATVAVYDFGEGRGSIVRDGSGHGRDLIIPDIYQPQERTILEMPADTNLLRLSFASDVMLNIVGFIPFALLSTWALTLLPGFSKGGSATAVVSTGALLSLSFELIQVYLPTRSSSLTDLLTNVLGAAVGVVLFHALELPGMLLSKKMARYDRS